ncbi:MAG: hypothetical protein ACJ71Z_04935 [Aeromicrobium sp.]
MRSISLALAGVALTASLALSGCGGKGADHKTNAVPSSSTSAVDDRAAALAFRKSFDDASETFLDVSRTSTDDIQRGLNADPESAAQIFGDLQAAYTGVAEKFNAITPPPAYEADYKAFLDVINELPDDFGTVVGAAKARDAAAGGDAARAAQASLHKAGLLGESLGKRLQKLS